MKNKIVKGIIAFAFTVIAAGVSVFAANPDVSSTQELIMDMGIGWNMGTSFECYNNGTATIPPVQYETLWNTPAATKEMFEYIKESGFDSVRIPITYKDHLDSSLTIDSAWMDRIETVVGWAIDADLYCIINIHHDTGNAGWIKADPSKEAETCQIIKRLWTQIANRFKNYDNRLLFEGLNETLDATGNWEPEDKKVLATYNKMNQAFVDAVRATGGQNENRFLVCNAYAAGAKVSILNAFELPSDIVSDRLIAGVHSYSSMISSIDTTLNALSTTLLARNIPVIVGEFGRIHGSSSDEARIEAMTYYVREMRKRGVACYWWDDGASEWVKDGSGITNFAILNRKKCEWFFPELVNALIEAAKTPKDESLHPEPGTEAPTTEESTTEGSITDTKITKLDYVSTTSSKGYLDTGLKINSKSKVEIKFSLNNVSSYGSILFASDNSLAQLVIQQYANVLSSAYAWYASSVAMLESNQTVTVVQDANKTYIDEKLVRTATTMNFAISDTLKFGRTPMKIYYCKVWNDGKLVGSFVPIIDTDGKVCFFDEVSGGKFYFTELLISGPKVDGQETTEAETTEAETAVTTEEAETEETVSAEETSPEEETSIKETAETEEISTTANSSANVGRPLNYAVNTNSGVIDTGITLDADSKVELTAAVLSANAYSVIMTSGSNNNNRIYILQTANYLYAGYSWYNSVVYQLDVNKEFVFCQDGAKTYVDGKLVRTATSMTFKGTETLKIGPCKMNIYSCKVWKKGVMVLDLQPIVDNKGTVCFVNQVDQKIYYATKSLTAGTENEEGTVASSEASTEESTTEEPTTEEPTTEALTTEELTTEAPTTEAPTTEAPTMEAPTTAAPTVEEPTTAADVESGYTLLEYATKTVNAGFIDMGVRLTSASKIELKASLHSGNNYGVLLFAQDNSTSGYCIRQETSVLSMAYGWYNGGVMKINPGEAFTILQDGNRTYINDNLVRTATKMNFNLNTTLKIGACKMDIYSLKIWEGELLVMDIQPVIAPDGIVCLKDKVSGSLIYASSGLQAGTVLTTRANLIQEQVAEIIEAAPETVPETTVPETTVLETTVPETTVLETTVPETTVLETTVPETTVLETTVPETTVPETTVPETTVLETTIPETTVLETTVLETTVLETMATEVQTGESVFSESIWETTIPETTIWETTMPEVSSWISGELETVGLQP